MAVKKPLGTTRYQVDNPLTDYSIWTLAYCQADMPYDFFGGSGLMSNRGTIQIPMIYTVLVGGEVAGKRAEIEETRIANVAHFGMDDSIFTEKMEFTTPFCEPR